MDAGRNRSGATGDSHALPAQWCSEPLVGRRNWGTVVFHIRLPVLFLAPPIQIRTEVRREFLQLIPSHIVKLIDGPPGKQPADVAIHLGIVRPNWPNTWGILKVSFPESVRQITLREAA